MSRRTAFVPAMTLCLAGTANGVFAADTPAGLVPGEGSAAFRFSTEVQTPKGSHAGSGTITLKRTGLRTVNLTIQTDDGKPARSVALIVGVDGSVAPDPADAPPAGDPNPQAAALAAEMTVAAHVGIGARKSGGASSYEVPIKLTPVGSGTPVATQLTMSGTPASYTGRTQGQTTTLLPQGGSLDPGEIAKTIGVASVARHAFTPAGRVATAVVMRHRRKQEKQVASGPLPDAMNLTVTADLVGERIHEIRGVQTDTVTLEGRAVSIGSIWSFTRAPG